MKISILILSHNRPKLFERCITSVIKAYENYNCDIEIIVNNDSNDITELYHDKIDIKYYYKQSENLGSLYKHIYDLVSKEYIYFLEDDDIMDVSFFKTLNEYSEDIFYFNYTPYTWSNQFIEFFKYTNNEFLSKEEFLNGFNDYNFQFGQICFKKKCLKNFPIDNRLDNDFKIFKELQGSFRVINKFLFTQTIDGGDNISFEFNKDERWIT